MQSETPPPPAQLMGLLAGSWVAQAISVAATLGVADALASGPASVEAIAAATKSHPDALGRLLRSLASVGVFTETAPAISPAGRKVACFGLTPVAALLKSGPGSMRAMATFLGAPFHTKLVGDLLECVRTGTPAAARVLGAPFFDFLAKDPAAAKTFDEAMTANSAPEVEGVMAAYDFKPLTGTICDVAGGHGSFLVAILKSAPHLRGAIYDLPHVVAPAKAALAAAGLASRTEVIAGDFFEKVPPAETYVMKHIIHDWDDARCVKILTCCRAAMRGAGRVLVVDAVIPPGDVPHPGKFLDIEMLLATEGGRERTESEHAALFAKAGLTLSRVVPTRGPVSVLEAVPAT